MKIKTTIHIYYSKYSWEPKGEYLVLYAKIDDSEHQNYVCSQEIEIEVPENLFSADIVFIAKVLRGERLEFSGPEALLQASAVCGSLPVDRFWECQVSMKGEMPFAVVELVPQKPKTIAPVLGKPETGTKKPPVISQPKKPHETTLPIRRLLGRSLLALVVFCLSFLCYLEFPWPLILCYFWPPPLSNIEIKVNLTYSKEFIDFLLANSNQYAEALWNRANGGRLPVTGAEKRSFKRFCTDFKSFVFKSIF